ncbi:MAG: hemin uptake protein HemP [Planctomycetota bacterium]|nr:MAG: hemin uptake protein HemP [Planctomycetota bacterium]REJ96221.1 MAG: hemin uptake protein HemP [Planctomycetota bacterium]REK24463.1 MAG: hemin uptake protein HemP [Planctomycetota bacterium]REK38652.1 MAG: hemin uptake protein HemP [Planctomycetota bacterium]
MSRPQDAPGEPHETTSEETPSQHSLPASPTFQFEELSAGNVEIQVIYNKQLYRLRKTRKGGLILTK